MQKSFNYPKASIVIVNLNGEEHLSMCLDTLGELNYPSELREIIVVDNASKDSSVQLIRSKYPNVKLIENEENIGFAKGINQGVRASDAKFVAFINNDVKVHRDWLSELIKLVLQDKQIVCAGSKVLNWEGGKIDFVGSMMNFEGRGFQTDFGKSLNVEKDPEPKPMLFVNGGAMLVNREIFIRLGGFDEDYFAYYEDVDFGWRVWLCGYKVFYVPSSVVYHRHHGTSDKIENEKLRLLYERNALYSIFKNYSWENLQKVLPAALLLLMKRGVLALNIDKGDYEINSSTRDGASLENVPKESISYVLAANDLIDNLPHLRKKREIVQAQRRRSDESLFHLFKGEFLSVLPDREYQDAQMEIEECFGIYAMFQTPKPTKVLIITHEVVSERMAGPAIRAWELAKVLSKESEVILAVPNKDPVGHPSFKVKTYRGQKKRLKKIAEDVDVIICQGMVLAFNPFLTEMNKLIVVDIYDPFILSQLEQQKEDQFEKRDLEYKSSLDALLFQLSHGHHFICASEKQRDFWIGLLAAVGKVNPQSYDADVTLRNLISVVPFGFPSKKPKHTKQVIRGTIPGIDENDKVIIWGGGIYNWFDPLSLIFAMEEISKTRVDVKLVFMGLRHPNPDVPEMEMAKQAVDLARKLGLLNKYVFFNFDWVPYEERQNYLLEADVGVSFHFDHIETRFSFRTRLLDYVWCKLPIIATKGDSMSELIEQFDLGKTVDPEGVGQITEAVLSMIDSPDAIALYKKNLAKIRRKFVWEKAAQPLIELCRCPDIALGQTERSKFQKDKSVRYAKAGTLRYYLGKLKYYWSSEGLKGTLVHGSNVVKRRLGFG